MMPKNDEGDDNVRPIEELDPEPNQEVITQITKVLESAERGEIFAFAYIAQATGDRFRLGRSGDWEYASFIYQLDLIKWQFLAERCRELEPWEVDDKE